MKWWLTAIWRSLHSRCPNCSKGRLFSTMLDMEIDRLVYECDCCSEEFI